MKASEILSHVDHTLLAPTATWEEMRRTAEEALRCRTASICVPPAYVARLRKEYGKDLNICTVIGFPLGYDTTAAKVFAAREAEENGADDASAHPLVTDKRWLKLNEWPDVIPDCFKECEG